MLSEVEVTYFRSRIDDVLGERRMSEWQRDFLQDMRRKIERYGTKTRFSEKQLATLKRLTMIKGDADLRLVTSNFAPRKPHWNILWGLSYREQRLLFIAAILVVIMLAALGRQVADNFSAQVLTGITSSSLSRSFSVTDGDTIKMDDGTRVRLVGFNTPEKFEPRCENERVLGIRASKRLVEIVSSGKPAVTKVACSCKPGTEGTDRCNYGRSCGILEVDGRDVGQTLIAEGLAVPFTCGPSGCPPTPRPWCG
jgi:endonuclease YncB( thermonuclease family)